MSTKPDPFGDSIKTVEHSFVKNALSEEIPIMIRLDGKAFHTFTKGLKKPYDERLSKAMINTMNFLIEKTNAQLGYTQSDEISLVYFKLFDYQQGFLGSRIQKLTSILASMATAKFNQEIATLIPEKANSLAFFDCRAWNVSSLEDAANVFVWRQEDAIKNAVSMAAHNTFSNKELFKKNTSEKIQLLSSKGIDFYNYPDFFKFGTFSRKKYTLVPIEEQLSNYSSNKNKTHFERGSIENYSLPKLFRNTSKDILFEDIIKLSINKKKKTCLK